MKRVLTYFLVLIALSKLHAQSETIPPGFTGIGEIVVGAKYDAIKKFLDPNPVWSRFIKFQIEMEGESSPSEEMFGPKDVWLVKKSETKFFTYMEVPVNRIEVVFDENNLVKEITLMIDNVGENASKVRKGAVAKFGSTTCAEGADKPSYFCMWDKGTNRYSVADWDAFSPEASESEEGKWVYVNFKKTGE